MRLTRAEIEFLSAWAREEWEPACYQKPAHRLQLAQGIPGAYLIAFIKAWTEAEVKKDQDILQAGANPEPGWPWSSMDEFRSRLKETGRKLDGKDVSTPAVKMPIFQEKINLGK